MTPGEDMHEPQPTEEEDCTRATQKTPVDSQHRAEEPAAEAFDAEGSEAVTRAAAEGCNPEETTTDESQVTSARNCSAFRELAGFLMQRTSGHLASPEEIVSLMELGLSPEESFSMSSRRPLQFGDSITVEVNGRALESGWRDGCTAKCASCGCCGKALLLSREHLNKYLIYIALSCVFAPLFISLLATYTSFVGPIDDSDDGGLVWEISMVLLFGLPCCLCVCCHSYVRLNAKPDDSDNKQQQSCRRFKVEQFTTLASCLECHHADEATVSQGLLEEESTTIRYQTVQHHTTHSIREHSIRKHSTIEHQRNSVRL